MSSQLISRKRKGDHLDEQHRGYVSINMLSNNHSIQNNAMITETNYIHHHQATHHPNSTVTNQTTAYYTTQNVFLDQTQNHVVPNKLVILNSNTNSSSGGSIVDESSRSEYDNMSELSLTNNNCQQRKQRHETSLGQLTKKFVGLLQDKHGELNLNDASTILQVQKRRIYDITNVLEGVGLLSKTFKNKIKWVGAPLNSQLTSNVASIINSTTVTNQQQTPQQTNQQSDKTVLSLSNFNKILQNGKHEETKHLLKNELDALDAKEKEIDKKIRLALNDLNSLTENNENKQYAFLTYLDIKTINEFSNQTVIAIKAPSETKLELADPREKLQMFLKSDKGEIEVYICPSEDSKQVQNTGSSCDFKSQEDQGKGESITVKWKLKRNLNKKLSIISSTHSFLKMTILVQWVIAIY